jgi:L-rhamnose mutarotase
VTLSGDAPLQRIRGSQTISQFTIAAILLKGWIRRRKGSQLMKRYGSVIRVRPEAIAEYKRYHAAVWPDILNLIRKCNIRNYSIYLKDDFLFGYFEYHGTDYQADMAKMAADPRTQEWWAVMMPTQQPLDTRKEGEWWAEMEEVFHMD